MVSELPINRGFSERDECEQRCSGCQVKHDVRRVRDKPITGRQEAVGIAKHDLITSGTFRFWPEKIGYPPSANLSEKNSAVANPKPQVKPARVQSAKIRQAEEKTDREGHALDEGDNGKTKHRVLTAYRLDVVQPPKRDPIVQPQKEHLECLQYGQDDLNVKSSGGDLLRHFSRGEWPSAYLESW